tara:strand:+ start:57 stop:1550 length:1494 start_codon:yes stop_codon:yes gene_type:complete
MAITITVALFSTRIVLNELGVVDFGIFNLVAGVIGMLSFLNAAISASTQRYLSFYLGSGKINKLKAIFNSSILLHLVIGLVVVVLLEIGGVLLFNGILDIPVIRINTAKIIFHFIVISTFFTINSVPFDAVINAHENMLFDAIVGILESLGKLSIAIWLIYTDYDRLIIYGLLFAILTILIQIVKGTYCYVKYEECHTKFKTYFQWVLFKDMFSFAGWNLFGALSGLGRNQGLAILFNLFYGVVVNAAFGIANQINGLINVFSLNMLKALNPQIVKSEGNGDRVRMLKLSMKASKFSFFLISFFAIPLIFEMPYILKLWLKIIPDYTIIFSQLTLIITLINQLSIGLQTAVQSIGKIKLYQTVVGGFLLLNLPISYFLLRFGFPIYSPLISIIVIEIFGCYFRIYFMNKIGKMSILQYVQKVILKITFPLIILTTACFIPYLFMGDTVIRFITIIMISTIVYLTSIFFMGLDKSEQIWVKSTCMILKEKFINRYFRQ